MRSVFEVQLVDTLHEKYGIMMWEPSKMLYVSPWYVPSLKNYIQSFWQNYEYDFYDKPLSLSIALNTVYWLNCCVEHKIIVPHKVDGWCLKPFVFVDGNIVPKYSGQCSKKLLEYFKQYLHNKPIKPRSVQNHFNNLVRKVKIFRVPMEGDSFHVWDIKE